MGYHVPTNHGHVAIGPFRTWLQGQLVAFDYDRKALAGHLGVHPRQVYRWLHQTAWIYPSTIDTVLTRVGDVHQFAILYPFTDDERD